MTRELSSPATERRRTARLALTQDDRATMLSLGVTGPLSADERRVLAAEADRLREIATTHFADAAMQEEHGYVQAKRELLRWKSWQWRADAAALVFSVMASLVVAPQLGHGVLLVYILARVFTGLLR